MNTARRSATTSNARLLSPGRASLRGARSRAALMNALAVAFLFAFTGCASRSLQSMDARYEKARLPNHFDRDPHRDGTVANIIASKSQKEFVAWQDTAYPHAGYSFSNAGYGADFSLLVESQKAFFGGYFGASPEPGNARFGGFMGLSSRSGILVGSASIGMGFNLSVIKADYSDNEWTFFSSSTTEHSASGSFATLEIPARVGLLFDLGLLSPYVSTALNLSSIGIEDAEQDFVSGEVGMGVEYRVTPGLRLRAEGVATNGAIEEHWTKPRYGARLELAAEW